MAEARFALGAVVDVASGAEVNEGFKSLRGDLAGMGKPKRIMRPLSRALGGLSLSSGQSTHLFMGRPAAGRVWVVTRVTVLGNTDHDTSTNVVAALYVGDDQSISLGQCVLDAQPIPFTSTQNEHAWVCSDKESVYLNITATGSNTLTQVVSNVLAWEYRDKDVLEQMI